MGDRDGHCVGSLDPQEDLEHRVRERTAALTETVLKCRREMEERVRAEQEVKKEKRLLRQLLDVQERDWKLMAYEIHDGFVQEVTGAKMLLEGFRNTLAKTSDEAWKTFDAGLESLRKSITEARRLISGLRPPLLDESGLTVALDCLIHEPRSRDAPEIQFISSLGDVRFAPVLENAVFRVVQESLTNACRYSGSDKVLVRVGIHGRRLRVEVRDWGVGFNLREIPPGHFGLRGIRERARLLGGHAVIHTAPGCGTSVRAEFPLLGYRSDVAHLEKADR